MGKNFWLLISGQTIANLADVFYMLISVQMIYKLTDSPFLATLLTFSATFIHFICMFYFKVATKHTDQKIILFLTQVLKTVIITFFCVCILFGLVNYFIIAGVFIINTFLDSFANPIKYGLVPIYVKTNQLVKANSIIESIDNISQIGNWLVSGILMVILGDRLLLIVVCMCYLLSSMLFFYMERVDKFINDLMSENNKSNKKELVDSDVLSDIKGIWTYILWDILENMSAPVWTITVIMLFTTSIFNKNMEMVSMINMAFFIGLLLTSLILVKYEKKVTENIWIGVILGTVIASLSTIIFGMNQHIYLTYILSLLVGVGTQLRSISIETLFQKSFLPEKISTYYVIRTSISLPVYGITTVIYGLIIENTHITYVYIISAIVLLLSFIPVRYIKYSHSSIREEKI